MEFLPINIRISDARILIVGGGRVATHKASILSRYTERVTVVAPEVSDGIKVLPFRWEERDFTETDLDGVTLLFVCTGDHPLNHYIHSLARQRGIGLVVLDAQQFVIDIRIEHFRLESCTDTLNLMRSRTLAREY